MRYFFNVCADDQKLEDFVGVELPDSRAARDWAVSNVRELWESRVIAGKAPFVGWLEVIDESQRAVVRVPL